MPSISLFIIQTSLLDGQLVTVPMCHLEQHLLYIKHKTAVFHGISQTPRSRMKKNEMLLTYSRLTLSCLQSIE